MDRRFTVCLRDFKKLQGRVGEMFNRFRGAAFVLVFFASGCEFADIGARIERSKEERAFNRGVVSVASARRLSAGRMGETSRASGKEPQQKDEKPIVRVFGSPGNCPPCRRFLGWWEGLSDAERSVLPMSFEYQDREIPEFATGWSRPVFYWRGGKNRWWKQEGWVGIEEFKNVFSKTL